MSTFSIIPCSEEKNTAVEDWTVDGLNASVTLRCAWSQRHSLVEDLLFNARPWPKGPYAFAPGCVSARIREEEPSGAIGQCITYNHALIDARYDIQHQDLFTESFEPDIEFQKLDHKRFRWGADDGDPVLENETPGKQLKRMTLIRSYRRVPDPLPAILFDGAGKVNDADYTSTILGRTFAAETLLYVPPLPNRTISTSGTQGWDLTIKFMYKEEGWNMFWRQKTLAYEEIHLVEPPPSTPFSTEYKNFPVADFSSILF